MKKSLSALGSGIGILGLAVTLLIAGHASPALADEGCAIVGNPWGKSSERTLRMPANSSSAAVRAAYANGTCDYVAGLHDSGTQCGSNSNLMHITVRAGGITYHVFDHTIAGQNGDDRFCTTGYRGALVND